MKKALLSLALAAILVAMIAAPALANVTLPLNNFTALGGAAAAQKGWATAGAEDQGTSTLTIAEVASATSLVLEVPSKPEGGIQFVVFGHFNDWSWSGGQYDLSADDVYRDGKLVFNFATLGINIPNNEGDAVKILVCYYDDGFDDLGATSAYLTTAGVAGGPTGDSTMIALALIVLTLAAGATVFVARKLKA
ncbi:MAG: hypothetical protein FWG72_04210 [Oscillospiraceae bacterium]|nr:hypothetical protein [Oscillospiraceae bacterium]